MGMTRVMCAVPSLSKVAESTTGAGFDCAIRDKHSPAPITLPQKVLANFMPTFVSDLIEEGNRDQDRRVAKKKGRARLQSCHKRH
jgi:hypothetical protein